MEDGFGPIVIMVAFVFFGWCVWVMDPRHPERLERLRSSWL